MIFELGFYEQPNLILQLFQQTQAGFDIVYLRARERHIRLRYRPLYKVFYYILEQYPSLKVSNKAYDTRILSRRALNSLLRLREESALYESHLLNGGYSTAHIEVNQAPLFCAGRSVFRPFSHFAGRHYFLSTFLRTMLLWIFIFSFTFLIGVIVNALKVKFTGVDLFGNQSVALSGWTFLVILISIFFAVTCLNLYIMSIYLSNIYNEIKQRPLYIIESIQRFLRGGWNSWGWEDWNSWKKKGAKI